MDPMTITTTEIIAARQKNAQTRVNMARENLRHARETWRASVASAEATMCPESIARHHDAIHALDEAYRAMEYAERKAA